ncbi:DUF488 family protein [Streptomyces sp. RKND-216]|uniref:DUF488 domain-containing protein n=1 Tax=Streptomyces sp. RKND-216 TaxID=2562581 RepID=UPI00109D8265|nr:DUF488 family protein [Streptomyces sp. RKND-216]THA27278.1 DUF488 family protein [Streptomyces sp. RKND-216]
MGASQRNVRIRRIYDEPEEADGARVLIDRLWPRGMSRDKARLDDWVKDVAPSDELRRWYRHDPEHYAGFARRYRAELAESGRAEALEGLRERAATGPLTLLTATRNIGHSHATVLAEELSAPR